MATNLVSFSAYQINQKVIALTDVNTVLFPTQGCMVFNTFNSPTRALSTGISVYAGILAPDGKTYYVQQTQAQVLTAFNA